MGTFLKLLLILHSRRLGAMLMGLPSYRRDNKQLKIFFYSQAAKREIASEISLGFQAPIDGFRLKCCILKSQQLGFSDILSSYVTFCLNV